MKAKDIDEIFDILEPYWDYTDYSLLEYLIKEFGTRELQQEMERYIAQLEQFEKDLAVQGKRDNERKTRHYGSGDLEIESTSAIAAADS